MQSVPGQAQAPVVSLTARRQQADDGRSPAVGGVRADSAQHRARTSGRGVPLSRSAADALQVVRDSRHPVFLIVHANGRRRYGYWQPLDPHTGRGGCYVALDTADCDLLRDTGRITLGEPLTDPSRTTYRVRPAETTATPHRTARRWARAA
ncbi:cell envelope biogenesis protein OmpA [Streptomyces sp. NPDC015220]|uniref:cell envelope biogenesis protein OmpA n=1 Tax=Streptomyces sp. NPDC015220 TaxID=3364947 RepID=UPI0036F9EF3D